jgi:hypothetical protein
MHDFEDSGVPVFEWQLHWFIVIKLNSLDYEDGRR